MKAMTAERYAAFLITYLPRFGAAATAHAGETGGPRIRPLEIAHEFVANQPGASLEFGVYKGASINFTAARFPNRKYYGFDSFEGFPDDGRKDWNQDFSTGGSLPAVPDNVKLIKGFFSDTLPTFLEHFDQEVRIVNIDCDIYSSTKTVFDCLINKDLLKPGVVLSFDELINYSGFLWNEMFAFYEMLEKTGLGFKCLAVHNRVRTIDEVMSLSPSGTYPSWNDDIAAGYRQQASVVLTDGGLDMEAVSLKYINRRVREVAKWLLSDESKISDEFRRKLTGHPL